MVEQKATIYITITGARLAGTLAVWVVMQDGVCIGLGEDYSPKMDNDGLVGCRKLNAYITCHPTIHFSIIGFELTTFERLVSPLPDNAGELSICISEQKAEMSDTQKQEIIEVKRVILALATEYKYCQRAIRVIHSNGVETLEDLENGISVKRRRAEVVEKFKLKAISKDKQEKRQQNTNLIASWRTLLEEYQQRGTTKTGQPWVVAADGSYRKVGSSSIGSYGWVSVTGEYGRGELDFCNNSSLPEVAAIFFALLSTPQDASEIRIITDSEAAIHLIERAGSSRFYSVSKAVELVREAMAGQNVTFEWVKGHQDHPLNVAADKLASYKYQRSAVQTVDLVQQAVRGYAELNNADAELVMA